MHTWHQLGRITAGAALALTLGTTLPAPAGAVTYQVGFLLDSSGSITSSGWGLIKTGLANAIAQFVGKPDSYQLSVMSFSSTTASIINKQIVTSGNLATLQADIMGAAFLNDNTNFNLAFTNMTTLMNPAVGGYAASYINFATDGVPNEGGGEPGGVTARDAAITAGIDNISIEGIGSGVNVSYLKGDICYPQACGTTTNFPGKGFYIAVKDTAAYAEAVQAKIAVIVKAPEPTSMALLGSGVAGIGVLVRRRRKR